jgi:hypothetical protein
MAGARRKGGREGGREGGRDLAPVEGRREALGDHGRLADFRVGVIEHGIRVREAATVLGGEVLALRVGWRAGRREGGRAGGKRGGVGRENGARNQGQHRQTLHHCLESPRNQ